VYAFNTTHQTFRQITSAVGPDNLAIDENANLIVYESADRKVYTFTPTTGESVTCAVETKPIALTDDDKGITVRYVAVTYKSATALTVKVWLDNEIESGDIRPGVTYVLEEVTATYSVTYNGTAYTNGQTFVGVVGKTTYTVGSGAGYVKLNAINQATSAAHTIPANNAPQTVKIAIRERARKIRVRIEDTSSSATATQIHRITIYTD
jgi:hypothetical protein